MRGTVSKRLRREAEKETVGQMEFKTKVVYKEKKKSYKSKK